MATQSKWFRVALEGQTTDGRDISRQDILDIVETFNPETYGARIWMEHFRGLIPGSPFDALGDVLAVKSQEDDVQIGGKAQKKLGLYAQIKPLDNLVALNKKGQKIYTSIEIQPDLAGTKKTGLVGLGVTDSPASLGTTVLQFSAKNPDQGFASRKQNPANLFTAAVETPLEFEEVADAPQADSEVTGAFAAMRKFFEGFTKTEGAKTDPVTPPVVSPETAAPVAVADDTNVMMAFAAAFGSFSTAMEQSFKTLADGQKKQAADLAALTQRLDDEPDKGRFNRRPPVNGSKGQEDAFVY